MTRSRAIVCLGLVLVALPSLSAGADVAPKPRILVGPNVLVSKDGNVPHVELMLAVNPKDPKNLLAGAITFTRPDLTQAGKTYASKDGGNNWVASVLPEQELAGGLDPQVAFGIHGTAYFAGLAFVKDETGRTRAGLHFFRSEDGGVTWQKPTDLGYSYDHEQILADHTSGEYAGRVYINTLHGYPEYKVSVFRSDDDGRTFIGPVQAATGRSEIGINGGNMMILSDGTLVIPFIDFPFKDEEVKGNRPMGLWTVLSTDGGLTFSAPRKVQSQHWEGYESMMKRQKEGGYITTAFPSFAVDSSKGPFKDRLYIAWDDYRTGRQRVHVSYSTDRGQTWSAPIVVDPAAPDYASQYIPWIAINRDGTVGIMWSDTRASEKGDRFDQYFSASVDGGKTFLPAVRASSATSFPAGDMNLAPTPSYGFDAKPSLQVGSLSAYGRWGAGGDYLGIAAGGEGQFHLLWADSREGTFQVYTCPVFVPRSDVKPEAPVFPEPPAPKTRTIREKADLVDKVTLVFDPVRYDFAKGVAVLPIRLRNVVKAPIFGPLTLGIKKPATQAPKTEQAQKPLEFDILNALNGLKGPGAEFDMSRALGDLEALSPGAVTEAILIKVKFANPLITNLSLDLEVSGFLERTEEDKR